MSLFPTEKFFPGDFLDQTKKSLRQTAKYLDDVKAKLLEVLEVQNKFLDKDQRKSVEGLKKRKEAIDRIEEAVNKLLKVEKAALEARNDLKKAQQAEIKLKKQLRSLTDEEVKAKLRFNKANKAQRDELKDLLILEDQQAGTLEKLAANNRVLRREREKLNLETEEGQQRLKEINDELDRNNDLIRENSDEQKKRRLNVGNYAESIIEAKKALDQESASLEKNIRALEIASKNTEENSEEQDKIQLELRQTKKRYDEVTLELKQYSDGAEQATKTTSALRKRLGSVGKAVKLIGIGALVGGLAKVAQGFNNTRKGALQIEALTSRFTSALNVLVTSLANSSDAVGKLFDSLYNDLRFTLKQIQLDIKSTFSFTGETQEIKDLKKEVEELKNTNRDVEGAFGEISDNFDNFIDRIKNTREAINDISVTTIRYAIAIEKAERSLAELNKEQQEANAIADDATLSFDERIRANQKVLRLNKDIADQELKIAEGRLNMAEDIIKAELTAAGITVQTREQILEILNSQIKGFDVSNEASRRFTDAFIANEQARTDASIAAFEQRKQLRELEQDLRERDLDILIDGLDNQKTINERIIQNSKVNFEERRDLLEETQRLAEDSFKRQIDVLQLFTKERIDSNELLASSDAEVLRERIRLLGLSEILEGRLLEVIRDRRTAVQDLKDATEELNEAEEKGLETSVDILAQEELLNKLSVGSIEDREAALKEFEERRKINEIGFLRERLEAAEEGSVEALEIEQELNDKLIEMQTDRLEKEKDARDKAAEDEKQTNQERLEAFVEFSRAIQEISERRINNQIADLDRQVDESQRRQDELTALAVAGNQEATQSISSEIRRQEELQRQKDALERRKARQKAIVDSLELLESKIENGEADPVSSTIRDMTRLFGIIASTIPGFYEGTTGKLKDEGVSPFFNTSKDSFLIRADGDEMILNPGLSNRVESMGMDTEGVVKAAELYKMGVSEDINTVPIIRDHPIVRNDNSGVENRLNQVISLLGKFENYQGLSVDEMNKLVTERFKALNGSVRKRITDIGNIY